MKEWIKISILLMVCTTSCNPPQYSTKNDDSNRKEITMNTIKDQQFIGSWELQEWTITTIDGNQEFPFGKDAIGQINYNSNGQMSVMIMKNNRPLLLSEDPLQGSTNEITEAFKGFIEYSGNFEVAPNSNQVVHQIKISSFPNWTGQSQIRNFEFKEDQLILSTDFIGSNKHQLLWNKIKF